jgi:hypothetical protein
MANDIRAKVFISCGQRKESDGAEFDEVKIAHEVAGVLENKDDKDMGFETYIAVYDRSLRGLKENIFSHLETSEYFLFFDFRREQFANKKTAEGRLLSRITNERHFSRHYTIRST